ncbi:hypothetical protein BK133_03720 [Paenibacillus sp. FSL H8-0548]|uniref:S-layer homology domain-containing protein n=1 Tax=Paenibacillus sp. FSL H8-0548 TaxID=1920422 RepID=UPI00096C5D85|nr:S-layer homology domain-containing protein [Paenibacillus sp. FSL H8-0548]OMF38093.1 hypothetical protein BK133_03720 [Paenibacillus sp. FSL H8-0548]
MKRKLFIQCLALLITLTVLPGIASAKDVLFSLTASSEQPVLGQPFIVTVSGSDLTDMYGFEINLEYNPEQLRYVKSASSMSGFPVSLAPKDGKLVFAHTKIGKAAGDSGKADLAAITFEAISTAAEPVVIKLSRVKLVKSDLSSTTHMTDIKLNLSPVVTAPAITFKDLTGHWAKTAIERAAAIGFVKGYQDGMFRPNGSVTRAEFIVMLDRATELKSKGDDTTLQYTDLASIPSWARPSIAQAELAGVVKGYEDGTFRPNKLISRAEMAVMVMRALDKELEADLNPAFNDSNAIPSWAKPSVAAAAELGIIQGKGGNKFEPAANATRAEAVVIILRILDVLNPN